MLACVRSAMLFGVEGLIVDVQVHVSSGLPGYTFVGLPDTAVRESRDRVRAGLLSSGLPWPQRRVTVNLAPAGRRKEGASMDLAVALGVLAATEQIPLDRLTDAAADNSATVRPPSPPVSRRRNSASRVSPRGGGAIVSTTRPTAPSGLSLEIAPTNSEELTLLS